MTEFKLNFEDTFDGSIADGTYEAVITKFDEDITQNGAEHIDVRLTIRNDVQQKHSNQIVFHKIWKSKKDGKYNMRTFNTIGSAAQLQEGKAYGSMRELMDDFLKKTVKITVKNETSEYNGKTYENLNVKRWEKSGFPELGHTFKAEDNPFKTSDVVDSDLPF